MQAVVTAQTTDVSKSLSMVIKEGVVTQAMSILTSGTFLIAFALKLGASSLQIGILTAIPLFANILQLASVYFVQQSGSRKQVVVFCTAVGRLSFLLIATLPFMDMGAKSILLVMLALCIQHGMGAVSTGAWSSWMREVIPQNQLGAFFSKRLKLSQLVSVVLSLGCAFFMHRVLADYADLELYAYSLLFFVGAVCGLTGSYLLYKTPEPVMPEVSRAWFRLICKPLRHRNFRNLMVYMGCWNFAVNLSVPFATVYMLNTLGLQLPVVIGLTTLTQLTNIVCFKWWGKYADQYGNKALLMICAPLYLLSIFSWTYTTMPATYYLTFPILVLIHIVNGVATAGTSLASSSIGMKLAPKKDSVAYLSTLSFSNALASGMAPLLGGWLATQLAGKSISWAIHLPAGSESLEVLLFHIEQWDFLFAGSFVFGLLAVFRLSKVKEVGTMLQKTYRLQTVSSFGWKPLLGKKLNELKQGFSSLREHDKRLGRKAA